MIIQPFRASSSDSFHINTLCPQGKAIEPGDRIPGDGGLPECGTRALVGVRLAVHTAEEALRQDQLIMADAELMAGFGLLIWFPGSGEVLMSEGAYAINGLTPTGPMVAASLAPQSGVVRWDCPLGPVQGATGAGDG